MSIRGMDVSDYQPNVNWQAVTREGIVFGGEISQKVGNIQKLLKIQGFYQGAIDGKFAASTKASLISFQKSKNLDADAG